MDQEAAEWRTAVVVWWKPGGGDLEGSQVLLGIKGMFGSLLPFFGTLGADAGGPGSWNGPKTWSAFCLVAHNRFRCLWEPTLAHLFGCLQTEIAA
jgi:hypothetical protein